MTASAPTVRVQEETYDAALPGTLAARTRLFVFERDTFAFPNELVWAYQFDATTGKTTMRRREPPPTYAHHCFVLARAVRQFFYHARFAAAEPALENAAYHRLVRRVMARNPRKPCAPDRQIVFPGYDCLRSFSQERERVLKGACGGAWQSYSLRSHWRMILPVF